MKPYAHTTYFCLAAAMGAGLLATAAALAYIDQPVENFTLPKLLLEFRSAGLYEVERVDLEKGTIRFKPLEPIQGHAPADGINHTISYDGRTVPPEFKNVKVGQKAVLFRDDPYNRAVTLLEGTWYLSSWDPATNLSRLMQVSNPYFECGFQGSVGELVEACKKLVRGETAVVRCLAKPKATETHWVAVTLREPNKKTVVPAAPADPPKPAPAADALPALVERLKAEKPVDRMEAAAALGRLGPGAKAATPALVAAFPPEKDPFARRAMIAALGAIGPDAREAAPALIAAVRDGYGSVDDLVGFEAVVALAKVDTDNAASSQYVLAMLRDKNPDVRHRAAALLGLMGGHLQAFAPALAAAMKDENPGVRMEAVRSFMKLRPDAGLAVPALAQALGDSEKNARFYAANGLADFGPAAKPALKPLMEAIAREKEPDARAREIRALRYIGPEAAEAVPMLLELLKDPNKEVQSQAEKAIKKIKPGG